IAPPAWWCYYVSAPSSRVEPPASPPRPAGSMVMPSCDPNDLEGSTRLIEDLTANARQVQQQVLNEILTRNQGTEYLHGFLRGRKGRDLFKKKVPVVEYDQVKPYIDRLANGEPSRIISAQPISELLTR
ncbi:hypothetical protein BHM03_00035396, partial [Ensete ventricosum]